MAQIQACPALIRSVGVARPSSKPCAAFDPPLLCSTALGDVLLLGHPAGRPSESDKSNVWRKQRRQKPDHTTGGTALSEPGWHPAGVTVTLETFTRTWISPVFMCVSVYAEKTCSPLLSLHSEMEGAHTRTHTHTVIPGLILFPLGLPGLGRLRA